MKRRLAIVVLLGSIISLSIIVFWHTINSKNIELSKSITANTELQLKKNDALHDIVNSFGYGGFIHHFKNYVIRHDQKYRISAGAALQSTYNSIEHFLSLEDNPYIINEILLFRETVDLYADKFEKANKIIDAKTDIATIDSLVKVDDTLAITSINTIVKYLKSKTELSLITTNENVAEIQTIYNIGFIIILSIAVIASALYLSLYYRAMKSAHEHTVLFKYSPDAVLICNNKGIIVDINQKARRMFEIPDDVSANFLVEDLIPDNYREKHIKHRGDFIKHDRIFAMGDRKKTFFAKKYNGTIFPVDIAISSYYIGNLKFSIAFIRDLTPIHKLKDETVKDALTHIHNRKGCDQILEQAIARSQRYKRPLSILMIDVDHFKEVNDTLGHQVGDSVLISLANIFNESVRLSDTAGRWGGEEFLIIAPDIDKQEAQELAEKIRSKVEKEFRNDAISVTISIGIAELDIEKDDVKSLIERSDVALYQSKQTGRNKTTVS